MAHRNTRQRRHAEGQQQTTCASINELPEALLVGILDFLAPRECSTAATVSRHWRNVADRHTCWSRFLASKWPCMKDVAARAAETDPRMTAKSLFIKMHQRNQYSHRRTEAEERERLRARLQDVSLLVEVLRAEDGEMFWSTAISVVDVRAMLKAMGGDLYVPLPPGLPLGVARRYASVRLSFIDPHAARISAPILHSAYYYLDAWETVTLKGSTWERLCASLDRMHHDGSAARVTGTLSFDVSVETLCRVGLSDEQTLREAGDVDDDGVDAVVPEEVQLRVTLEGFERVDGHGNVGYEAWASDLQGLQDMPLKVLRAVDGMMRQVESWY